MPTINIPDKLAYRLVKIGIENPNEFIKNAAIKAVEDAVKKLEKSGDSFDG